MPLENFTDYIQLNFDNQPLDLNMDQYNYIIALDIIEHLSSPEAFLDQIRFNTRLSKTKIILTTPNIGFIIVRLQLLFGGFNYGKKGILDYTHKRLFTFKSLKRLCEQSGYKVKVQKGVPAPFPVAIGNNWLSRFLLAANRAFIGVRKSLFAYQIYAELEPLPMVEHLMKYTMHQSEEKEKIL